MFLYWNRYQNYLNQFILWLLYYTFYNFCVEVKCLMGRRCYVLIVVMLPSFLLRTIRPNQQSIRLQTPIFRNQTRATTHLVSKQPPPSPSPNAHPPPSRVIRALGLRLYIWCREMVLMIFWMGIADDFNEIVDILEMAIFMIFLTKLWKFAKRKIYQN